MPRRDPPQGRLFPRVQQSERELRDRISGSRAPQHRQLAAVSHTDLFYSPSDRRKRGATVSAATASAPALGAWCGRKRPLTRKVLR